MTDRGARRRVFVTGATGFVGGAVSAALLDRGDEVVALSRSAAAAAELSAAGARVVVGDMTEPAGWRHVVAEVDAVVHAAQPRLTGRVTGRKLAGLFRANAVATDALVDACREHGRRLLYTSGVLNYGDHGDDWITESTPLRPAPISVGHAEQVRRLRGAVAGGLDAVVLNLGFVYGPGGTFANVFHAQAASGRLRCLGSGANWWSVVHVEDVAAAFLAALDRAPAGAEYNVVDDRPLRLREFVDQLTDALGRRRVGSVPTALAGLAVGRPAVESLTTSYRVSNAKARGELDWAPTHPTFADGLPPTLAALAGRTGDRVRA